MFCVLVRLVRVDFLNMLERLSNEYADVKSEEDIESGVRLEWLLCARQILGFFTDAHKATLLRANATAIDPIQFMIDHYTEKVHEHLSPPDVEEVNSRTRLILQTIAKLVAFRTICGVEVEPEILLTIPKPALTWEIWCDCFYAKLCQMSDDVCIPLEVLYSFPDPSGFRVISQRRRRIFFQSIRECFTEEADRDDAKHDESTLVTAKAATWTVNIIDECSQESQTVGLTPFMYSQMFNIDHADTEKEKMNTASDVKYGRHHVLKIYSRNSEEHEISSYLNPRYKCFYLKFFPEQPGTEACLHLLDERLTGGLDTVPIGMLAFHKKGHENNRPVIASISPAVDMKLKIGPNDWLPYNDLDYVLENAPHLVDKIDSASFTRTLVRVILSNPEDDKPNDYFLVACESDASADGEDIRYRLVRIDNERAFLPVSSHRLSSDTVSSNGDRKIPFENVKSIILCLNQMNRSDALDVEFIRQFSRLESLSLLRAWMNDVERLHINWKHQLGNTKTICDIFEHPRADYVEPLESDVTFCVLLPVFPTKLMTQVSDHVYQLSSELYQIVQQEFALNACSGFQLLRTQPALHEKYFKVFLLHRDSPYKRFYDQKSGPGRCYDHSRRTSTMPGVEVLRQTTRLDHEPSVSDIRDICEGQAFSYKQARSEFEQVCQRNYDTVKAQIVRSGPINADSSDSKFMAAFESLGVGYHRRLFSEVVKLALDEKMNSESKLAFVRVMARSNTKFYNFSGSHSLSAFADVMDDGLLQVLVKNSEQCLRHIDISNCSQISNKTFLSLSSSVGNQLESLKARCVSVQRDFSNWILGVRVGNSLF